MAVTQFDDPVLTTDGRLVVRGPFVLTAEERQRLVGDVVIRFLVIQDADRNRDQGSVGDAMAEDTAVWKVGEPNAWERVVPADRAPGFAVGARVRGIGYALLVMRSAADSPDEPPSFQSITWCVSKKVVQG